MLHHNAVKDERFLDDLVTALAFRERELEPLIRPLSLHTVDDEGLDHMSGL